MKTKINIAILIVVASITLVACVEEEIKGPQSSPAQATGIANTHSPIK